MEQRQKILEIFARDDARWDASFSVVNRAGVVRNRAITAYDPPKDPGDKEIYDRAWHEAKRDQ